MHASVGMVLWCVCVYVCVVACEMVVVMCDIVVWCVVSQYNNDVCHTTQLHKLVFLQNSTHTLNESYNRIITDLFTAFHAPVIDKGSFVPIPSVITRGSKSVTIGTPVYVHSGFDVIIDCNTVSGTPPINITWFRNGSPYPTIGNDSTITITDASNGDVFKCRADNIEGFDTESTTIYVKNGKCICHKFIYSKLSVWTVLLISHSCSHQLKPDLLKMKAESSGMHISALKALV